MRLVVVLRPVVIQSEARCEPGIELVEQVRSTLRPDVVRAQRENRSDEGERPRCDPPYPHADTVDPSRAGRGPFSGKEGEEVGVDGVSGLGELTVPLDDLDCAGELGLEDEAGRRTGHPVHRVLAADRFQ